MKWRFKLLVFVTMACIPRGITKLLDSVSSRTMECHFIKCTDYLLKSNRKIGIHIGIQYGGGSMSPKTDVMQGTLGLMVLKTLYAIGPLHGYGIARRIEQISGNLLSVNYGTIYPALLKLEQEGCIVSEWGVSDNNRKAKYYKITRTGLKQLQESERSWAQTRTILDVFMALEKESK
jgi:PadR family transcriptional regulator, regulatory protein PadR